MAGKARAARGPPGERRRRRKRRKRRRRRRWRQRRVWGVWRVWREWGVADGEPAVPLHGMEPLYRDGVFAGFLRAAGFGFSLEASIGYAYILPPDGLNGGQMVSMDYLKSGAFEIDTFEHGRVAAPFHHTAPGETRADCDARASAAPRWQAPQGDGSAAFGILRHSGHLVRVGHARHRRSRRDGGRLRSAVHGRLVRRPP